MRERKRMLRLLIEDVTLLRDRTIQLHIRWKGGATTSLECPLPRGAPDLRRTPATIVEMVRALATEQTDRRSPTPSMRGGSGRGPASPSPDCGSDTSAPPTGFRVWPSISAGPGG